MTASPFDAGAVARKFLDARSGRSTLASLAAQPGGLSVAQGYEVAASIAAARIARGERRVGRKIGLTNQAVWAALDAAAPIWGTVYDSTLTMASGGTARLDLSAAVAPRIEPEIGFCLHRPLDPARLDFDGLLDAIEWFAPCFEVVDTHIEGWKFKAADAIADFGVHYALVVGEPVRVAGLPRDTLAAQLEACEVTLSCNGAVIERGRGGNTLGHPLGALAALATVLAANPGQPPLEAGEIITTGTLTPFRDIAAGERWAMHVTGLPLAALTLDV